MPRRIVRVGLRVFQFYLTIAPVLFAVAIAGVILTGKGLPQFFITEAMTRVLSTPVTFSDMRIRGLLEVELKGLMVGVPDRGEATVLVRQARLVMDWRELLRSKMTVESIELDGWAIWIESGSESESEEATEGDSLDLPNIEFPRIRLLDGTVIVKEDQRTWRIHDIETDAMVRLDPSQYAVRIRELAVRLPGDIYLSGEGSAWRLGKGVLEIEFKLAGEDAHLSGNATLQDREWSWNIDGSDIEIAPWAAALFPDTRDISGRIGLRGEGINNSGTVYLTGTSIRAMGQEADSLRFDLRIRENAYIAEQFVVARSEGSIRGAAGLAVEEGGTRLWSNVIVDSMIIPVSDDPTERLVCDGEMFGSGWLGDTLTYNIGVVGCSVRYGSWELLGIDAEISGENDRIVLNRMVIQDGVCIGELHGRISPDSLYLEHDLMASMGPLLEPFYDTPVSGTAFLRGTASSIGGYGWDGKLQLVEVESDKWEIGTTAFEGKVHWRNGGPEAFGSVILYRLERDDSPLISLGSAQISATSDGVSITQAGVVRPNGVAVFFEGSQQRNLVELERLGVVAGKFAAELIGTASLQIERDALIVPHVTLGITDGGRIECTNLKYGSGTQTGRIVIDEVPISLVARTAGLSGQYDGSISAGIDVSGETSAWLRLDSLRRLPAMKDFPTNLTVHAVIDSEKVRIDSVLVTQSDLEVRAHGTIGFDGRIRADASSMEAPIASILVVVDELASAGLRKIFDARSGRVSARLSVKNSLNDPDISGSMIIHKGAEMIVRPMRIVFNDVTGSAVIDDDELRITQILGKSGEGTARLSGSLWLPGFELSDLDFTIVARSQEFKLIRGVYGLYDADLELGKSGRGIRLSGDIILQEALIDLSAIMNAPVPPTTPESMDDQWSMTVRAERGVWARDRFMNAEVAGEINVTKSNGIVSLQGELELLRGNYRYLDRKFQLQKGTVTFPGGPVIEPIMNVTATTVIRSGRAGGEDIELQLTILGTPTNPELSITSLSDDVFTEEQLKAMLLYNLTPEEIGSLWQGDTFAKEAAGTVEGVLADELARALRSQTGLDELELSSDLLSSEDRDLRVGLGEYLTPDLFVSLGIGVRGLDLDEFRVEYILDRYARKLGIGKNADLKLVGERVQDEYDGTTSQVQLRLRYRF